jgi:palmitoyltransferase
MFDHHCPYIGNCIGEKNKLLFFWYLLFQAAECWVACWLCYEDMEKIDDWDKWCKANIVFVIVAFVPFLLGVLITCLWVYHLILGFKNWTTYEVLRWNDVYYLKGLNRSPFDLGPFKNFAYYCRPYKKTTLWRIL